MVVEFGESQPRVVLSKKYAYAFLNLQLAQNDVFVKPQCMYCKDTEPLYNSFIYSLVF